MTAIIGAILRAGSPLRDLFITATIVVGGVLMLGACIYRLFVHPEWSAEQALGTLWPFYLIGACTVFIGWLIDRQPS